MQCTHTDTISLHAALPIYPMGVEWIGVAMGLGFVLSFGYWCTDFLVVQRAMAANSMSAARRTPLIAAIPRSEEHTSELQSQSNLVCRLLLEKHNKLS